jgi:hypothetical protein
MTLRPMDEPGCCASSKGDCHPEQGKSPAGRTKCRKPGLERQEHEPKRSRGG